MLLWGKTDGNVKAIIGVSGLPFTGVARNPDIKRIKDCGPHDRIAVPTAPVDPGHYVRHRAAEAYRDDKANGKLVPNQVQLGHPDALTALLHRQHEVTSHLASWPFQEIELKSPGIHVVVRSREALGGEDVLRWPTAPPSSARRILGGAFFAAYEEAVGMIKKDPKAAAANLSMVKEHATAEEIVRLLTQPRPIYRAEPVRAMVYAEYMAKTGFIKPTPTSWKDHFSPLFDREGAERAIAPSLYIA